MLQGKDATRQDTSNKWYLAFEIGMEDAKAEEAAMKYKTCQTYNSFGRIIRNVTLFPKVDIRDLNINQIVGCY